MLEMGGSERYRVKCNVKLGKSRFNIGSYMEAETITKSLVQLP